MRKRAPSLRRYSLRLDALEERTLLSALIAIPVSAPTHSVIVEPVQPFERDMDTPPVGPEPWYGPDQIVELDHMETVVLDHAQTKALDHAQAEAVASGTDWARGFDANQTTGTSSTIDAGVGPGAPAGTSIIDVTSGSGALPAATDPSGPMGGPHLAVLPLGDHDPLDDNALRGSASAEAANLRDGSSSVLTSASSQLTDFGDALGGNGFTSYVSEADSSSGTAADGFGAPALLAVYRTAPDGVVLLLPLHLGPDGNGPMHVYMDDMLDGHPTPAPAPAPPRGPAVDLEVDSPQAVVHVEGSINVDTTEETTPAREGRDATAASPPNGFGLEMALALRVAAAPGQDSAASLDIESPVARLAVPVPDVAIPAGQDVARAAVQAAAETMDALGSVAVGHGGQQPGQALVAVVQAETETPSPQGFGVIENVLPFDRDTVVAAIDRFFDRFDQSGTDVDEDREPAGLYPPPGAVLLAVAALEAARRYFKRQSGEDAAARPRRREMEGLGFDESFGSSGPWSSRLS